MEQKNIYIYLNPYIYNQMIYKKNATEICKEKIIILVNATREIRYLYIKKWTFMPTLCHMQKLIWVTTIKVKT